MALASRPVIAFRLERSFRTPNYLEPWVVASKVVLQAGNVRGSFLQPNID